MGSLYPIETVTVGSGGQATITFSNIPQTYAHLLVRISSQSERTAGTANSIQVKINSITSGYSDLALYSSNATASGFIDSGAGAIFDSMVIAQFYSNYAPSEIMFLNYTNSQNKTYSAESAAASDVVTQYYYWAVGTLSNTAAITSITLSQWSSFDFSQHTKVTLYGISNS